jgi:DNA-binding CsgD family transcriptional regulator
MLVGREAEFAALDRLLGQAEAGHGDALVLRGEAGVGKSALLEYARAAAEGFRVLRAVGIESEAELAFAGLHQLVGPVLERAESLPPPQAAALRAAFGLSDETVAERFRISLGVLGLLAAAAEERPVLCIVDDAQWLDEASASALLFAARRLGDERIGVLFAARDGVARPFVAPGVAELHVSALRAADARALASQRLGADVADAAVEWVLANASGNPLALIELPQALTADQRQGREPLSGVLPPATSVERAYVERVAALPGAVQEWLLVVAAEETGDRATIQAAAALLGLKEHDLGTAEATGLVSVAADRISFRHPLVRSAVYRGAPFVQREGAHQALAEALSQPADADRRAWHRAMASSGPNDEVAAELEATADRAQRRAGFAGAASAFERAARLSTDGEDRSRRTVSAALAAWQGGQRERATALLRTISHVADPMLRARRDHIFGLIELSCGSQRVAGAALLAAADVVAGHSPDMAMEILLDAGVAGGRSGDPAIIAAAASRAAALPRPSQVDDVIRDLLISVGSLTIGLSPEHVPILRSSLAALQGDASPRVLGYAALGAAAIGAEGADATLARTVTAAREAAIVPALVLILDAMVLAAHMSGRYSLDAESEEGLRLARETGLTTAETSFIAFLGWAAALRGDDETCVRNAEVVAAQVGNGMAIANTIAQWAVAVLDLSRGDAGRAATRLLALRAAGPGEGHPLLVLMASADLAEACAQAGRPAEAAEAVGALATFAQPDAPVWAHALAARCRAVLADPADAAPAYGEALELLATVNRPFDMARTQLAYGSFLRRQRRRADAREQLRAAVERFERLGAEQWAERASVELRATGETARRRDPSTLTQLTPQETQIARLVGEGNSNKDVAAQLFLSPRTVEYHLAKVFAKLGITSRAELIRQRAELVPVG